MTITSVHPVLMTTDVATAAAFFEEHFGFQRTFGSDWYVSLRSGSSELAVLHCGHDTVPMAHRGVVARGLLVNVEVDDVDAVHASLAARDVEVVLPIRSEDFGQRHFIVAGPEGVLVDVITPIEPSSEFAASFAGQPG